MIVLVASDGTQHIRIIQQLVCWLDEAEHLQQLATVSSQQELHAILLNTTQTCATEFGVCPALRSSISK
ncbi:hypothetical protein [Citrobacter murliniae]